MYPHERSLVEKLKDKPFTLLGVNSDKDRAALKKIIEEKKLTWRSFWNGPQGTGGPISKEWNVQAWPTVYLIDHTGTIRVKNPQALPGEEKALDEAIDKLIKEAEAAAKVGSK
jgi:AhpC/TSA family